MVEMTTHRQRRPPPARGGQAPITEAQYQAWLRARADVAAAKQRLTAATAALDSAAGHAAQLTVDGVVVIEARRQRTGGGYIGVNYREDWRQVKGGNGGDV